VIFMLTRRNYILLSAVFIAALAMILLLNTPTLADTDIKITICDPDRINADSPQEGNTINTVLSSPSISYGENRELGTVQITGKPGIAIPVQEGQKMMVKLPPGISYMQVPDANNYKQYIEWPTQLNGKKNQICDSDSKPGISFVTATPHSLTVEVSHVDTTGDIMVIDLVFNQDNYSKVRVAPFIEVAEEYSTDAEAEISRLEFFIRLAELTWPFSDSPVKLGDSSNIMPQDLFTDVTGNEAGIYKIIPLIESDFIKGYEGGLLKPEQSISRAEAAHLAGMIFGTVASAPALFKDPSPIWAQKGITAAFNAGIIHGYPDGTFRPNIPLSRPEAIIILQNCLESYSK
jgi:hypothetical protein